MEKAYLPLLLFLAPILQIVLCVLRYRGKIKLPIWAITILMLIAGFTFSYLAEFMVHPKNPAHPVMPMVLAFGVIVTGWSVPIIAIITGASQFFRWQAKRDREKAAALAKRFISTDLKL